MRPRSLTYDGWKATVEWDGNGNFSAWNVYGAGADEILCRYSTAYPQRLRYHADRMGTIHTLLNDSGILERYTYDAFGQPRVTDADGSNARSFSAWNNRFMFTGREWLPSLGLYDYRNRFYEPSLGRFLQPDPIGFAAGDPNLFRYCAGDPVNCTDPSGLAGSGAGQEQNKPQVPKKKDGPTSFTTTTWETPTGSHIPEMVTFSWNGSTWDVTSRDSINGTNSLGSYAIVSGGGFSGQDGGRGGATVVPAVAVSVASVIERGNQAGAKSVHQVLLTPTGKISLTENQVGHSTVLGLGVRGWFHPSQRSNSSSEVTMSGMAGSYVLGLFSGPILTIDYTFNVAVNFSRRTATVSGSHDGYPSYYVAVHNSLIYSFRERSLLDLRPPMEITVLRGFVWVRD
jgi:RHS repeat-associated protein